MTVAGFLLIWVVLAALVISREYRSAIVWSLPVGVVLGLWAIAPTLLRANHLHVLSLIEWVRLDAVLALAFAATALLITVVLGWPVCVYWSLRNRKSPMAPPLVRVALVTAVVIVGYLGIACFVEWHNFRRLPAVAANAPVLVPAVLLIAVAAACAAFSRRERAAQVQTATSRALALSATVLVALGCGVLPLRVGSVARVSEPVAIGPLRMKPDAGHVPPLLVIGLDGGNWETMRPLIARRPESTFARLAAGGMTGTVEALWPPYWSTPAWGSILTGYPEDQVGVHEDLTAVAPGLPMFELPLTLDPLLDPMFAVEYALIRSNVIVPMPAPRQALKRPPIWERLSKAGVKTAVIRFPFTYPADRQADYVVSNRVITDLWDQLGVKPGRSEDLVGPPDEAAWLKRALARTDDIDPSLSAKLLPLDAREKPSDAIENPADVLDRVLGISQEMFSTTEQVIRRDPGLRAVMLHVTSFDNICHAFWQYRFPDAFGKDRPATADIARLGPVVDRYLEYVDGRIGQLIAAFPEPPNVIIVADHGEEASSSSTLWRGWHAKYGVFIAGGPNVAHQTGDRHVLYFDIVPTMLDLLGVEPASGLSGRSLAVAR